jgi:hypothetical protein
MIFISCRIIALISGTRVHLVAELDADVAVRPLDDAVGHVSTAFLTGGASCPLAADEALGRVDGVLGVGDGLPLGDVPDEPLAGLGDRHHRGRGLVAAPVRDHRRVSVLDDRHARVGGAEVDADDSGPGRPPGLTPGCSTAGPEFVVAIAVGGALVAPPSRRD